MWSASLRITRGEYYKDNCWAPAQTQKPEPLYVGPWNLYFKHDPQVKAKHLKLKMTAIEQPFAPRMLGYYYKTHQQQPVLLANAFFYPWFTKSFRFCPALFDIISKKSSTERLPSRIWEEQKRVINGWQTLERKQMGQERQWLWRTVSERGLLGPWESNSGSATK